MISFAIPVIRPISGLLIVLFIFCVNTRAQTIYTWVDDQGVSHFSHYPVIPDEASAVTATRLPYVNTAVAPSLHASEKEIEMIYQSDKPKPEKTGKQLLMKACQRYEEKLKTIQSAMRRGYTEPQGNRYREQRRKYSELLLQYCR